MSPLKKLFVVLLIVLPLISIFYKTNIEDLSLIPKSSSNQWKIQLTYDLKKLKELTEEKYFELPILSETQNQIIDGEEILGREDSPIFKGDAGKLLKADSSKVSKVSLLSEITLNDSPRGEVNKTEISKKNLKIIRKKYLDLQDLSEDTQAKLENLSQKFIKTSDTDEETVRKIYFYITEEIITKDDVTDLGEVISLAEGSEYAKAKLMTYLARINGVPSRINFAYRIEKNGNKKNLKRTFFSEVIIGKNWYPVSINALTFTRVPSQHIIVYKDVERVKHIFKQDIMSATIAPVMVNKIDSVIYQQKLASVSKLLSFTSLHSLPLNMQSAFFTILLIPLGTLVLSFGRNIIGVKAFGIFTPILLTLFFLETSVVAGLIFFTFIVLLGFFQRYILDRFYLLAIPRLSILLTLVIISYTAFSLIAYQEGSLFPGGAPLNYLPIVIITSFIERFSVHFIEEGAGNTLSALFGTIFISLLCYFLFSAEPLKLLLFNNPEILLIVIAVNILVGSYKGYRLSELTRFKEFKKLRADV